VKPDFRRGGIGSKLFTQVVDIAKKWGAKRMDWQVLDWNQPAIEFYKKHQAILDSEWINGRFFFD
jgi:GNAT superfamily N-acetyltransferase